MATLATEGFEGAANGVQMSTGNTIFSTVTLPTNWHFSNTHVKNGNTSGHLGFASTTGPAPLVNWTHGATMNLMFMRIYVYPTNVPPTGNYYHFSALAAATRVADIGIVSNGTTFTVKMRDLNTQVGITTTPQNGGAWFRLEWKINKTLGTQEMRLFIGADVDNPAANYTDAALGNFTQVAPDQINFGFVTAQINDYYFDDFGVSDSDWLGPIVPPPPTPVVITHTLALDL